MCALDPDIDYAYPHGARGYAATLSALSGLLDADWHVADSGGGCQLIVSGVLLEGGYRIQVSDRDGPLSPYLQRAHACRDGRTVGWAVGIYSAATDYAELHGLGRRHRQPRRHRRTHRCGPPGPPPPPRRPLPLPHHRKELTP